MLLENHTNAPAILQCADLDTEDRYAVVIWKLTYDLPDAPEFEPWMLSTDPMPITGDPVETDFGNFHGDIFLRKQGVDLCVLGHLRRTHPVTRTSVTLRCGEFVHTLSVTGDRIWEHAGGDRLVPSRPAPFTTMNLSCARSFGGAAEYEGMFVPFQDNPIGIGYYLQLSEAFGRSLPNIEAATSAPIRQWDDKPTPAGWGPYPMNWGLRARAGITLHPTLNLISSISPSVYNNAHPDLVVPAVEFGDRIELLGVYDHPIGFSLPQTSGNLRVRVGDHAFDVPMLVDGVYIWLDAKRVVVTQRANFHYLVQPGQVRVATLTAHHG